MEYKSARPGLQTTSLDALIERHFARDTAQALRTTLAESVRHASIETWHYREDHSYFPPE